MKNPSSFKWRHFEADGILLCVRWYMRYALSYRDLEEIMLERGLSGNHATIYRLPCSGMLQNLKNAVDLTSKPATTPGKWMRRASK